MSLDPVMCEMSIKHPSRYVIMTVGYISLSETQGGFINNCQYFFYCTFQVLVSFWFGFLVTFGNIFDQFS